MRLSLVCPSRIAVRQGWVSLDVTESEENHLGTTITQGARKHDQQETSQFDWPEPLESSSGPNELFSGVEVLKFWCIGWFREFELSPWKEVVIMMGFNPLYPFISSPVTELTMIGTIGDVPDSILCFLGLCSCWWPGRKLPTTTWFLTKLTEY